MDVLFAPPPSAPPPTVFQRFESDPIFRCSSMGIQDDAQHSCCSTVLLHKYCCHPCVAVKLNVTSSGLTERGRHYSVEQCVPEAYAKVSLARRARPRTALI